MQSRAACKAGQHNSMQGRAACKAGQHTKQGSMQSRAACKAGQHNSVPGRAACRAGQHAKHEQHLGRKCTESQEQHRLTPVDKVHGHIQGILHISVKAKVIIKHKGQRPTSVVVNICPYMTPPAQVPCSQVASLLYKCHVSGAKD